MGAPLDLVGQKYHRWTVLEFVGNKGSSRMWLCKCDCGTKKIVNGNDLRQGKSKSCGCYNLEQCKARATKHNGCGTRLYYTYKNMIGRCYRKSSTHYDRYGARGIKVCDEWLGDDGFLRFREWAYKSGYKDNLTIERKDIDKDYCPDNCTWITIQGQALNRRTTHWVSYKGITHNITQWAEIIGINRRTLSYRMKKNGEQKTLKELLKEDF